MEYWGWNEFVLCVTTVVMSAFLFSLFLRREKSGNHRSLPPGPPGWPIFGNMFQLGAMPHKTLAGLKQKYGPDVVWLKIGSINTMAIQSSKAAAELFKNHDICFVERTITETMTVQNFHKCSISLAPYGTYWRVMKRVMTTEMLVNKRINDTVSVRRKCVDHLVSWIEEEANNNTTKGEHWRGIQVSHFVFLASYNMLGNLMLSRDLVDPQSKEGNEFFSAMISLMGLVGQPNIVDLFPWLRWLDPQGLRKKADRDMLKTIQIVSKFVRERLEERKSAGEQITKKDFLEVLLEFHGGNIGKQDQDQQVKISERDIDIIIMEVFVAGTETTSGTVEWAMVELLNNPSTMFKVKEKLKEVVGNDRKLEETDIDNLKYLQAVVKETMRLHPPIPLLVPRKATRDTNFMGYDIPKDTQLLVNAWAIGREAETWDSPDSFMPERFLSDSKNNNVDFKGQHYEFIPFGAGRRICAGIPLGHRMLHIVLGTLLHKFDWSVHDSLAYKLKDNSERIGVVVRKIEPLIAIPYPKSGTS